MLCIVLLSGGIDSTVVLAKALAEGHSCRALSFDYGQRHSAAELASAQAVAAHYQVSWQVLTLPRWPQETACALLSPGSTVPIDRDLTTIATDGIPSTYVPARNTLFLAHALAYAEICEAEEIHCGANADDTAPYPDCRPAFFSAFQEVARQGTRQGARGQAPLVCTPLLTHTKRSVVALGRTLQIPFELTFSCYNPTPHLAPCHRCDACRLRHDALTQS